MRARALFAAYLLVVVVCVQPGSHAVGGGGEAWRHRPGSHPTHSPTAITSDSTAASLLRDLQVARLHAVGLELAAGKAKEKKQEGGGKE